MMKGTYVLLVKLERPMKTRVGSLGRIDFRRGYYAYVGSGQNSLLKRVGRHMRSEKKKHWHIDYLLDGAEILKAVYFESGKVECELAKKMGEQAEGVKGFGCSDCKCTSHLFYSAERGKLEKGVTKNIRSLRDPRLPCRTLKHVGS